jgi:hypothetical protein
MWEPRRIRTLWASTALSYIYVHFLFRRFIYTCELQKLLSSLWDILSACVYFIVFHSLRNTHLSIRDLWQIRLAWCCTAMIHRCLQAGRWYKIVPNRLISVCCPKHLLRFHMFQFHKSKSEGFLVGFHSWNLRVDCHVTIHCHITASEVLFSC